MLGPHTGFNLASSWKRATRSVVATCYRLPGASNVAGKHNLRAEKWREREDFEEFQGISRGTPELWEGVYRG